MDAQTFFAAVAERAGCDARRAEGLALGVFRELRARISAAEARDVASQLPSALKRLWETDDPGAQPGSSRIDRQEFLGRVRRYAGLPSDTEAEVAVRAVFRALQLLLGSAHGTEGEAWDVLSQLPKGLKQLWLDAARDEGPLH